MDTHDTNALLRMIERVEPDDTAKLGEIDARVDAYIYGGTAYAYTVGLENEYTVWGVKNSGKTRANKAGYVEYKALPTYTRSRDAIKAVRPVGNFQIEKDEEEYRCVFGGKFDWENNLHGHKSPRLPTEELAELHAVIQSIAYERGQS